MKKILLALFLVIISFSNIISQSDNVQLDHPVYIFLKEMSVKGIIPSIHDDDGNMSRREVRLFLDRIDKKRNKLSSVELSFLKKYQEEFFIENSLPEYATSLFQSQNSLGDIFSDKLKFVFTDIGKRANLFVEIHGNLHFGNEFLPNKSTAFLYNGGFNFRGSFLDNFGYRFFLQKGQGRGSRALGEAIFPILKSNLKWDMNQEETSNYDFTDGYLRYEKWFDDDDFYVSAQIGREQLKLGLGYNESLVVSGKAADMDFIKFQLRWGVFYFTSVHGTFPGRYDYGDILNRYTKHIAINRMKFSFPNLLDVGFGTQIVYGNRGMELGYLNPFIFYKFVEHSMQDRDNGVIFIDLQTHLIDGWEFQATGYLDETLDIFDPEKFTNKTGYQLGVMSYSPFGIDNLSLIFEYSLLRPYVYTHKLYYNTVSSWDRPLGHEMGPNSDQIFIKAAYNLSDRLRISANYQMLRHGENVYDENGNLIKNVGGDIFVPFSELHQGKDDRAYFLDGERYNTHRFNLNVRWEPLREYYLDFIYNYEIEKNLSLNNNQFISRGLIRLTVEY